MAIKGQSGQISDLTFELNGLYQFYSRINVKRHQKIGPTLDVRI